MDYKDALIAAGAEVLAYETFGSYQGDWWAKVNYEGKQFWVRGSYGSCSGCDALQHDFGWRLSAGCEDHEYTYDDKTIAACSACQAVLADNEGKFAAFGKGYLTDEIYDQAGAEAKAAENLDWDQDARQMWDFLRTNSIDSLPVIK